MQKDFITNNKVNTASFASALRLIEKSRYILIITHVNPDADTICSGLALSNYFKENRIAHKVFNVGKNLPQNCDFLGRFDKITDQIPNSYDLIITVDCGSINRLGIEVPKEIPLINFDHHKSNDDFGTVNIVDINKSSTSEIIYDFFRFNGLYITKKTAESLYVGIYDDSLAFTTSRCDEHTYDKINFLVQCGADPSYIADKFIKRDSLAKYRILPKIFNSLELLDEGRVAFIHATKEWFEETGATNLETEVALNMVLNIAIVDIAVYFRVVNDRIRISLRSKRKIDVSCVASTFGGGGHLNAAGCVIDTLDIDEAKELVKREIFEEK